jgi:hypothetical protein
MKNPKISKLYATIIILIVAITAGVFVWKIVKNQQVVEQSIMTSQQNKTQQQENVTSLNKIEANSISIDNWKNFSNKENEITLRYPSDLFINATRKDIIFGLYAINPSDTNNIPDTMIMNQLLIYSERKNYQEIANGLKQDNPNNFSQKATSINGRSCLKITYNRGAYAGELWVETLIMKDWNNTIVVVYPGENQKNKAIFDKILSTIEIEEANIAGISNAKSYLVDDFLNLNSSISTENVNSIKELSYYDVIAKNSEENSARLDFVKDTIDKNIIYFINTRFQFQSSLPRPDIYKFNLKTNKLARIYKSTTNYDDYELVGIKDSKLLFFKKGFDDSPGPCFNLWVDAYEHLLPHPKNQTDLYKGDLRTIKSINLSNINAGFSNFTVPKEKYKSELALQKNCIENFDKN